MKFCMTDGQSWLSAADTLRIATAALSHLGTPFSAKAARLLRAGNFAGYLAHQPDYKSYTNSALFYRDYQAANLVKKAEFLDAGIDRKAAATKQFLKVEEDCRLANARIFEYMRNGSQSVTDGRFESLNRATSIARDLIRRILGDKPTLGKFRFGPGSTSLVSGVVTLPKKYARCVHVTSELYSYWRDVCGPVWASTINNVDIITGSTVSFVPKNAKTDRTICTEPHVNIYAQLGAGASMRQAFVPWIDLTVGQERNRTLAAFAKDLGLATVDFESASDSICRALIWFLCPEAWALLLDKIRSHRCVLGGEELHLEKHSSMGNGYTFELESIIFYSLAYAATKMTMPSKLQYVSAYGDDVILPQESADLFMEVCEFLGFTVNREKSFLSGSFFESCGSDYFDGVNVRPKQWKRLNPNHGFKVHNDLVEIAKRTHEPKLYELADEVRMLAPVELQSCLIPQGYGNTGFIVPFDDASPSVVKAENGWCGFKTKALKYYPEKKRYGHSVQGLLAALDTGSMTSESPVRRSGTYRVAPMTTFGHWEAQTRD